MTSDESVRESMEEHRMRELLDTWREIADTHADHSTANTIFNKCADDLEEVLKGEHDSDHVVELELERHDGKTECIPLSEKRPADRRLIGGDYEIRIFRILFGGYGYRRSGDGISEDDRDE